MESLNLMQEAASGIKVFRMAGKSLNAATRTFVEAPDAPDALFHVEINLINLILIVHQ